MADRPRLSRSRGVRLQITLAATLVVALTFAVACAALVLLQRRQLEASLVDVARRQASDVALQVSRVGSGVDLGGGSSERSLLQVVDRSGHVVASSPTVAGEPPVVRLAPGPGSVRVARRSDLPIGEGEPYVVVVHGVASPGGEMVVIAAQSLESVRRATGTVVGLLAIGYPLILVLAAGASYGLSGRALAPVEAMRRRVATIGADELSKRVPVPPGDDEISRLATTMNAMLTRLEDAADAQRRFVADASHELRSPLATIRATHEVAALHTGALDHAASSRDVLHELDRLDHLVSDLLLLARTDEHGMALHEREVDLDDLVRAEAERARRSGLAVDLECPHVRVSGDPTQLQRLIRNLVDNALSHADATVGLQLRANVTTVTLDVVDDGPGIAAADRDRVFDRFVRLDPSRARDKGGTGLGLPIARQIARAHGGEVAVVAGPGGARLRVVLPLAGPAPVTT